MEQLEARRPVDELTEEELDELKQDLYYNGLTEEQQAAYFDHSEIPGTVVKEHYAGISFVREDFFCNMPEETGGCVLQAGGMEPVQEATLEPDWVPEI